LQESKPILAVKGIAAPKVAHLTPPSSKYTSPTATIPRNSPASDQSSPSKRLSSGSDSGQQSEVTTTVTATNACVIGNTSSTLSKAKTAKGIVPSQSPTVGVVSPMMSHRVIKLPKASNSIADGGNQSDTSTTSGSRDSDNASVIYNPTDEANSLSNSSAAKAVVSDKKPPPVPPVRTNSRLETTFDSNCGVTTSETTISSKNNISTFTGSDLEGIRPMEPIIPLVPPPYNVVVRNGKTCRQSAHSPGTRNGKFFFVLHSF
uniref:PAM2 domain-containing protein n=1 Tax=Elaeophora elaphi TaxID=1147741 RepID=A0A0R3RPV9_9BILA